MHDHREHGQRGRRRQNDSEKERVWRQRLDGHKESGLSIRAYCRREGISEPLFYWWRREIARRGERGVAESRRKKPGVAICCSQPGFAEMLPARQPIMVPPAVPGRRDARPSFLSQSNSSAIEIVLRGGRVLRVRARFDHDLLLEVARLLEGEVAAC